jgi:hypothetical protein
MERCVFCRTGVALADRDGDLVWVDATGRATCRSHGVGAHYPGREADLFWRGSSLPPGAVVDLTGPAPVVHLAERRAGVGGARRRS